MLKNNIGSLVSFLPGQECVGHILGMCSTILDQNFIVLFRSATMSTVISILGMCSTILDQNFIVLFRSSTMSLFSILVGRYSPA